GTWATSRPPARPSRSENFRPACSSRSRQSRCNSASTSNARRLLARDHAAPESTLALTKAPSLGCERVRPLAWCSRPRNSTASLADALVDKKIEDFVRGLHLDAYLVGGAGRDELRRGSWSTRSAARTI